MVSIKADSIIHQIELKIVTINWKHYYLNMIYSCFVFKVDEVGHEEIVDSLKNELIVVPKENNQKIFY